MSSNTKHLGLLKKDPIIDKNETFNIQTMLNENWDKIDDAVEGGFLQSKAYIDEQINLVTATGIPKLVSYPLQVTATEDKQTTFEIPLDTFDVVTDTLLVVINRAFLDASQYTVKNGTRDAAGEVVKRAEITLVKGVSVGSEISLLVLKNVPIGEDGSINGAVLAVDSVPVDRLKGIDKKLSTIGHSNMLKNSTGMFGFEGWSRGITGKGWSISNNAWKLGTPYAFLNYKDSGFAAILSDPISVVPNEVYSLSAMLAYEGQGGTFRVLVTNKEGNIAVPGSELFSTEKRDYYTSSYSTFTIPEGWNEIAVVIQCLDTQSDGAKYVSNIMLNRGKPIPWNDDLSFSLIKGVSQTTANLTYYVDGVNGSDSNDGVLSTTPFKTINKAIALIPQMLNHSVNIYIKSGDYSTEGILTLEGYLGAGQISLYGRYPSEFSNANARAKVSNIACNGCKNGSITIQYFETTTTSNVASIDVNGCDSVSITWCTITNASNAGVMVGGSNVGVSQSIISNQKMQALSADIATVVSRNNTGTANNIGLIARSGGLIVKDGTQPGGITAQITNTGGEIRS